MATVVSLGRARADAVLPRALPALLRGLAQRRFERLATRELLGRALEQSAPLASWLNESFARDESPMALPCRLFPQPAPSSSSMTVRRGQEEHDFELGPDDAIEAGALLRAKDQVGLSRLIEDPAPESEALETRTWPAFQGAGIQRREHASLLVRSRQTAVLIDPVARLGPSMPGLERAPAPGDVCELGAVAITHSHRDHWHLPTILEAAARPEVPVIVPRVSRVNLLCTLDFESDLRAFGQRSIAPAWGETIEVGDLEIDVLPFRGEQPTACEGRPPDGVRNIGNCYRLHCDLFSVMVMVDSGPEPDASVEQVVQASVARRGAPDAILACFRQFSGPFFSGLPVDWLTLERPLLEQLWAQHERGRLPSVTQGPRGWARIAKSAGARYLLPYAHGFQGVGAAITDSGWGAGEVAEAQLLEEAKRELVGSSVAALAWNPGDWLALASRTAEVRRGSNP